MLTIRSELIKLIAKLTNIICSKSEEIWHQKFKVSFAFLLELLSTGFCFVRLALTGKLIKACPPFYVVWLILFQYLEGFNNMNAKKLKIKNK